MDYDTILDYLKNANEKDDNYESLDGFMKDNKLSLEDLATILLKYQETLYIINTNGIIITKLETNDDYTSFTYFVTIPEKTEMELKGRDLVLEFKKSLLDNPIYKDMEIHIAYVSTGEWTVADSLQAASELNIMFINNPIYPFGPGGTKYERQNVV